MKKQIIYSIFISFSLISNLFSEEIIKNDIEVTPYSILLTEIKKSSNVIISSFAEKLISYKNEIPEKEFIELTDFFNTLTIEENIESFYKKIEGKTIQIKNETTTLSSLFLVELKKIEDKEELLKLILNSDNIIEQNNFDFNPFYYNNELKTENLLLLELFKNEKGIKYLNNIEKKNISFLDFNKLENLTSEEINNTYIALINLGFNINQYHIKSYLKDISISKKINKKSPELIKILNDKMLYYFTKDSSLPINGEFIFKNEIIPNITLEFVSKYDTNIKSLFEYYAKRSTLDNKLVINLIKKELQKIIKEGKPLKENIVKFYIENILNLKSDNYKINNTILFIETIDKNNNKFKEFEEINIKKLLK